MKETENYLKVVLSVYSELFCGRADIYVQLTAIQTNAKWLNFIMVVIAGLCKLFD